MSENRFEWDREHGFAEIVADSWYYCTQYGGSGVRAFRLVILEIRTVGNVEGLVNVFSID